MLTFHSLGLTKSPGYSTRTCSQLSGFIYRIYSQFTHLEHSSEYIASSVSITADQVEKLSSNDSIARPDQFLGHEERNFSHSPPCGLQIDFVTEQFDYRFSVWPDVMPNE